MDQDDVGLKLLGPVRVRRGADDRPVSSGRRAALLAVLAIEGEASRERLIAAVWGDDPPASANGNVYTHVNALRDLIGGDRLTREDGLYRLHVPEQAVDIWRFERLREQARRHRAAADRPAELAAIEECLGLWDGPALDGAAGPFAAAQRARLDELRIGAEQRRAEILLDLGRPGPAVAALRALVADHPSREPAHRLLRTALDAAARQTRDVQRAIAFLGPGATGGEVGQVTGLPPAAVAEEIEAACAGGVLRTVSGTVAFRDPAVERARYAGTPATVRAGLHAFFAQMIADASGPPERVAAQLLRTGPAPLSPPAARWLLEHVEELIGHSPEAAVALLRKAHLQHLPDAEVQVALTVWLARLLFRRSRDAVPEAGWAAARAADPEVQAEMMWIAANGHDRRGNPVAAADIAQSTLSTRRYPQPWLDRFRGLLLRLRPSLPGVPTEPRHGRAAAVAEHQVAAYRRSIAADGRR